MVAAKTLDTCHVLHYNTPINNGERTIWQSFLKDNYENRAEWTRFSETYGLAEKLGYPNADAAWHDNPFIQGSSNPADFGKADLVAYYGKRMKRWDADKLDREDAFAGPREDVVWGNQDAALAWRDAIDKEKVRRACQSKRNVIQSPIHTKAKR